MSYNEQLQQACFGPNQTNNHAVAPLPSPSIVTGPRMGNHFSIYFLISFSIPPPYTVHAESNLICGPLQKTHFFVRMLTSRQITHIVCVTWMHMHTWTHFSFPRAYRVILGRCVVELLSYTIPDVIYCSYVLSLQR